MKDINEIEFLYEEIITESIEPRYPTNLEIITSKIWGSKIITYKFTTKQNNTVKIEFLEEDDTSVVIMFTVNGNLSSTRTERDIEILPNVLGIILRHMDKYETVQFSAFSDEKDEQMGKNRRLNIYTKLINKYSSSKWYTDINEEGDFYLRKK